MAMSKGRHTMSAASSIGTSTQMRGPRYFPANKAVPVPQKKEFSSYSIRKDEGKTDIVIDGLGWACVSGEVRTITVHVPKGVNVTFRKAML